MFLLENPVLQIFFQIVLFILVIVVVHYLWVYVLNVMAPKKTIHLVDNQIEKYKQIMEEMQKDPKDPRDPQKDPQTESDVIQEDLDRFIQSYL
jgi:uncharacterized membrane protein